VVTSFIDSNPPRFGDAQAVVRSDHAFGVRLELRATAIDALRGFARSSTADWTPQIEDSGRHTAQPSIEVDAKTG
jgi:hypothetical protein